MPPSRVSIQGWRACSHAQPVAHPWGAPPAAPARHAAPLTHIMHEPVRPPGRYTYVPRVHEQPPRSAGKSTQQKGVGRAACGAYNYSTLRGQQRARSRHARACELVPHTAIKRTQPALEMRLRNVVSSVLTSTTSPCSMYAGTITDTPHDSTAPFWPLPSAVPDLRQRHRRRAPRHAMPRPAPQFLEWWTRIAGLDRDVLWEPGLLFLSPHWHSGAVGVGQVYHHANVRTPTDKGVGRWRCSRSTQGGRGREGGRGTRT